MRNFDEDYLQAIANRDPLVENELVYLFTRPIKLKLRNRLRSPQAIEDACQETLLRVFSYFRNGKTLRSPSSLPAFIHSVCNRVAMETLRASHFGGQPLEELPELVDLKADPEGETIALQRQQIVWSVLAELSEKDRRLLRSACIEEEDRDAICSQFHVSRDHLRLLLYRARLRFKALIQQGEARSSSGNKPKPQPQRATLQYLADGSRAGAGDSCGRALPFRGAFAG